MQAGVAPFARLYLHKIRSSKTEPSHGCWHSRCCYRVHPWSQGSFSFTTPSPYLHGATEYDAPAGSASPRVATGDGR